MLPVGANMTGLKEGKGGEEKKGKASLLWGRSQFTTHSENQRPDIQGPCFLPLELPKPDDFWHLSKTKGKNSIFYFLQQKV